MTSVVFTSGVSLPSLAEVNQRLFIGAPPPEHYDAGTYTLCATSACTAASPAVKVFTTGSSTAPVLDESAIFEIAVNSTGSAYLFNKESLITIANASSASAFSFRNPPRFMTLVDPMQKDALYETDALLDHLFYHQNVGPFVARSLIQRLVSSNPSPRYVAAATAAFNSGEFAGSTYSGRYGDVGAMVAAILLDREARSLVLDADVTHGQIREPLVRIFALMRAMDFQPSDHGEVTLKPGETLEIMIGQGAYYPPSVFNFYTQDFQPDGPVQSANLVSPEAQLATLPWIIGLIDGMTSLIFDGLSEYRGGFGSGHRLVNERDTYPAAWAAHTNYGYLHWQPTDASTAAAVVDELSLLLTSGRLDAYTRGVVIDEYNRALVRTACPVDRTARLCGRLSPGDELLPGEFITNTDGEVLCHTLDGVVRHVGVDGREVYSTAIDTRGGQFGRDGSTPNPLQYIRGGLLRIGGWRYGRWTRIKWHSRIFMPGSSGAFHTFLSGPCLLQDQALFNLSAVYNYNARLLGYSTITCSAPSTCAMPPPTPPASYAAVRAKTDAEYAIKVAQNLIAVSAAAATTNDAETTSVPAAPAIARASLNRPYKALVVVYLAGGADTFNMLVPHSNCDSRAVHQQYTATRGAVALSLATLRTIEINATQRGSQVCDTFGLHGRHAVLQQLWNDGDASFTANVGSLVEPMTLQQYIRRERQLPAGIFAHNLMSLGAVTMFPQTTSGKTGILGRLLQAFDDQAAAVGETPFKATAYSVTNSRTIFRGSPSDPVLLTRQDGMKTFKGTQTGYRAFNTNETNSTLDSIRRVVAMTSGSMFSVTHNAAVRAALRDSASVAAVLDSVSLTQSFPTTILGTQLEQVAKVIAARNTFEAERDLFYVELGGFDAHSEVIDSLDTSFVEINAALSAFVSEMKSLGVWDQITLQSMSEFGRTLTTNGQGTDHAWGGNHFTIGGSVRGGVLHGTFPELRPNGPNCVSPRCPLLPSSPWEAIWRPLVQWLGVSNAQMGSVLPNLDRFSADQVRTEAEFFK